MPDEASQSLSGTKKAAILLLSLDSEASSKLLGQLPEQAVEVVTRELASVGRVSDQVRDEVLREFYDLAVAQSYSREGGLEYARSLLKRSIDPA